MVSLLLAIWTGAIHLTLIELTWTRKNQLNLDDCQQCWALIRLGWQR